MNLIWFNVPNIARNEHGNEMNDYLCFSHHWGKWDNSDIVECKPGDEMNQDRFNAMQEAYDNMSPPDDDEFMQTQEEIDAEEDQQHKYASLMHDAIYGDFDGKAHEAFCEMVAMTARGELDDAGELLSQMIINAASYDGNEATVPDFVRLVRMAFEWKSKQ